MTMDEQKIENVSDVSPAVTRETVLIEVDSYLVRRFDKYFRAESDSGLVAFILDEFYSKHVKYQERLADLKAARALYKSLKGGHASGGPKAIARPAVGVMQQASDRTPK
jgi:hypothetical protein